MNRDSNTVENIMKTTKVTNWRGRLLQRIQEVDEIRSQIALQNDESISLNGVEKQGNTGEKLRLLDRHVDFLVDQYGVVNNIGADLKY